MMPRLPVKVGDKFGLLTVARPEKSSKRGSVRWSCSCVCGKETMATSSALTLGKKKSCGCLKLTTFADITRKHGLSKTPTYVSWQGMWTRCTNRNFIQFKDYGGAGITVCERWKSFINFIKDMGPRPGGMSLDRIDPFGNYEPSNCRWATRTEQNRNTRGHAAIAKLKANSAAKLALSSREGEGR